jgi:hypothetical protein
MQNGERSNSGSFVHRNPSRLILREASPLIAALALLREIDISQLLE